jgi:hypothetical protein
MYFQIKEIILWPKNKGFKNRRLSFKLGAVNVITGASRTGKSAVIPIIDYCLGSDKCRIPVNTIRNSCEWFGVLIQTNSGQKLFARREPGNQKATGDMFILEAPLVDVPETIESKNAPLESVKTILNEIAGLTTLDFDPEDNSSGFKSRPSFRDLGAFSFQPQNVVANPDILFYKTETYEHREKLRTIFPFVLNAISPAQMAKRYELANLKKTIRKRENELSTIRQVSERWMGEIKARVSEAKELGFVQQFISPEATKAELIELLNTVVNSSTDNVRVTEQTIIGAVGELVALHDQENELSMELSKLRKRFSEMSSLKESTIRYKDALAIQKDRLGVSKWISGIHKENHECPICGNSILGTTNSLDELERSLNQIEEESVRFDSTPVAFDREFERVRSEIRELTEELKSIQIQREALTQRSEEAKQTQYDSLKASRFIGNLEQSLHTYARIGTNSELDNEINELNKRIRSLEQEISEKEIESKRKSALEIIQSNAEKLLPDLDVERPNDPISLSIDDLTIKVGGVERDDYLWEMGSGSNWLAYHIAITLGLQQFFVDMPYSPIPSFLVYDQPSQVYFPKRLASKGDESEIDPKWKDEDIVAVRKVFEVLTAVVNKAKGKLQIIVLDHATKDVWGKIEGINCVEEWRDENKLVPLSWIS